MQNMFTTEHQARIIIDTYRDEARHHDLLKLARLGQTRHVPGAMLMETVGSMRERLLSIASRERRTASTPACHPGVAC